MQFTSTLETTPELAEVVVTSDTASIASDRHYFALFNVVSGDVEQRGEAINQAVLQDTLFLRPGMDYELILADVN